MRRISSAFILSLLFLFSASSAFASYDDEVPGEDLDRARGLLMGTFMSSEHPREVNRKIERAVHQATANMNFLIRGKARGHLFDLTRPCKDFTFSFSGEDSIIQCEDRKPSVAPADGGGRNLVSAGGEAYELVHVIERDDRITQFHRSKNGVRRDVYVVSLDGRRMTVHTTIQSRWLSNAVEYQLQFVRRN